MESEFNSRPRSVSLREAEQEATRNLDSKLHEYLAASERAYNLIGIALGRAASGAIKKVSASCFVRRLLLIRLRNDLRCAALLAARGYGEQSCSLVASLYESVFTIVSIGGDDKLAQSWLKHGDPASFFLSPKRAVRDGIRKLGVPDAEKNALRSYENVYQKLCMVKHMNPISQKRRGYEIVGTSMELFSGPDTSEEGLQVACFALENSVGLTTVALASFGTHHLGGDQRDLVREVNDMVEAALALNQKSAARWMPK